MLLSYSHTLISMCLLISDQIQTLKLMADYEIQDCFSWRAKQVF